MRPLYQVESLQELRLCAAVDAVLLSGNGVLLDFVVKLLDGFDWFELPTFRNIQLLGLKHAENNLLFRFLFDRDIRDYF